MTKKLSFLLTLSIQFCIVANASGEEILLPISGNACALRVREVVEKTKTDYILTVEATHAFVNIGSASMTCLIDNLGSSLYQLEKSSLYRRCGDSTNVVFVCKDNVCQSSADLETPEVDPYNLKKVGNMYSLTKKGQEPSILQFVKSKTYYCRGNSAILNN